MVAKVHIDRLTQRMNYLTARIAAKKSVGWETVYDEEERNALAWALEYIKDYLYGGCERP